MVFSWLKAKPVPAPTDLELQLVDALQAATDCIEEHNVCADVAVEAHEVLEKAKDELGIVGHPNALSPDHHA